MPEYQDIVTTMTVIFMAFGGIIVLDKIVDIVMKVVDRMKKPKDDLEEAISAAVQRLDKHDDRLDKQGEQLEQQGEKIRLLMRGVSQLMTHEIDGNHVDQLTKTRDDMNEYLINRV